MKARHYAFLTALFLCQWGALAVDTVEGPYKLVAIGELPGRGAISLHYNTSTRTARRWVDAGDSQVGVDVGIIGYGIEAYISFTGQLVAVDRETQKTAWHHDIGGWYNNLAFVTVPLPDKKEVTLLRCGGRADTYRFFDIPNGKEKYLVKDKDSIQVLDTLPIEYRGKELKPVTKLSGDNSNIVKAHCQRITTQSDWRALWERHNSSEKKLPKVDFKKHMVVAVFDGAGYNTSGINLLHAIDCKDAIELFIQGDYYQTMNTANAVTAYGIFIIAKSEKKLLIKRNIQNYIGGPERWHLLKAFEKL